jgi:predicted amidohydrolase
VLIITQERWHVSSARADVERIARAGLSDRAESDAAALLLLPLGEVDWQNVRHEQDLIEELAPLAVAHNLYIAGAATVIALHSNLAQAIGFVIAPDGSLGLRTAKIAPDLIDGFTDSTSELGRKAEPAILETPLGRIGMLINEDALFSHYARLLVYAGAEIMLNPAREKRDAMFESRQRARATRAYENSCYFAVATPRQIDKAGLLANLPTASALYCYDDHHYVIADREESFLIPDLDIVRLRRKRMSPFFNQPVYLRSALYAPGYRSLIEQNRIPAVPRTKAEWQREAARRVEAQRQANLIAGQQFEQYEALLIQGEFRVIQKQTTNPREIIQRNLDEALTLAGRTAAAPGVRLVCFSEFFMTGSGGVGYRSPATLERIAVSFPGNEIDQLSEFAMKNKVYIGGSAYESDPKFPGRVFNTAFILNDSGDLILRYRKLHCADIWGSLPDTTPASIYTQYLDTYGYDYLFPVVDTPIGKLASIVCFDHTVPETVRMLTKRGAEIIIHNTSDNHGAGRRGWEECRETRAYENAAYILAPRPGGEYFDPDDVHPGTFLRGYTRIVGFDGRVWGEADTSGKTSFSVGIDLAALRRHRAQAWTNLPIWDDPEVYAHLYEEGWGLPMDVWAGDPSVNPYKGFKQMNAVLERYYKQGVYLKPEAKFEERAVKKAKDDSLYISP